MAQDTALKTLPALAGSQVTLPAEVEDALKIDARAVAKAQRADAAADMRELATMAGVPDLAPAMAEEAKAKGKIQRALSHQIAAAHNYAMTFIGRADTWAKRAEHEFRMGNTQLATQANIEAARVANTAARLMSAMAEGALTLDRLKRGAKQIIVIQRMDVSNGGQAIVAGKVGGGGKRRRRSEGTGGE